MGTEKKEPTDLKFEDALARLELIVQTLEAGNLPLEESLKAFEEGVALTRFCARYLEEAERRIELLTKDEHGVLRPQPFGWEDEEKE
ncbi:MAG TPA: exodeoxyribonuclease VII small subunit [Methylomirabilota bacterium]|nr:exodeoxyribonuclease VII small subunit [Methylomirabilota bacterium]